MKREKPSERLQFALDALIEAEKPEAPVKPDMYFWHKIDSFDNSKCFACLGGLAAIKRFDLDYKAGDGESEAVCSSSKYDLKTVDDYELSLNNFRTGIVSIAFGHMGIPEDEGQPFNRSITSYHRNQEQFKDDIRQLIKDLQAAGY